MRYFKDPVEYKIDFSKVKLLGISINPDKPFNNIYKYKPGGHLWIYDYLSSQWIIVQRPPDRLIEISKQEAFLEVL